MDLTVPGLKVTFDVDRTPVSIKRKGKEDTQPAAIFCDCHSDYCDCGSTLGVTEASASKIYKHLGFPGGRETVEAEGYRPTVLHIWGTHSLSTEDVLTWLSEYKPTKLEWIDDASCNVIFDSENTVLRIIVDFSEPFDRRVALAAAAALASLIESEEGEGSASNSLARKQLHLSTEALDSVEQFSQYFPPSGRWYKVLSVPPKTIALYLRFAHSTDVKLPGAERRSLYYRRFGNPNYGGMTGVLSRSYRRRLRLARNKAGADAEGNLRHVRILSSNFVESIADAYTDPDPGELSRAIHLEPNCAPERELIVYDNLYEDGDKSKTSSSRSRRLYTGNRREAIDFPVPTSNHHPHKWSRKDRGPAPNRWPMDDESDALVVDLPRSGDIIQIGPHEPWSEEAQTIMCNISNPFDFLDHKPGSRPQSIGDRLMTITLRPDPDPVNAEEEEAGSMTMVADREQFLSKNRSMAGRLGFGERALYKNPKKFDTTNGSTFQRNVWQRLG